ncbi:MAG: hypothetical protein J6M53_04045 [Bacteroidaceae bacterium]|nr:hypothetical protein [Bacteroidaceae bacterium]
MKTKFFLFFLLLCLGFSSCKTENWEEDLRLDGPWQHMEWKTIPEIQFLKELPYCVAQLPAAGGEYTFICTTWGFSVLQIRNFNCEDIDLKEIIVFEELTKSQTHFENEWLSITIEADDTIDIGKTIKIVVQPNQTTSSREMYLTASHGDVFTHFLLRQAPVEQESEP